MIKHYDKLRDDIESGFIKIGNERQPMPAALRKRYQKELKKFKPEEYPDNIPSVLKDASCNIFGHICPVFLAAEAISETSTTRRTGRYIPFETKVRVVRRDNYTCQRCGVHLRDYQVEFDHKIPVSRGGSSEEHNIQLTCLDCNRDKIDRIEI